jgi:hypothetical protein
MMDFIMEALAAVITIPHQRQQEVDLICFPITTIISSTIVVRTIHTHRQKLEQLGVSNGNIKNPIDYNLNI